MKGFSQTKLASDGGWTKLVVAKEEFMRKYILSAALASATLAAAVSLPDQANAMTIGVLSVTAPTQLEQAGWCGARRACLGRPYYRSYEAPPPYAYWNYRPFPYYNYFLGSGWPSYGWYK
jgi:hypothetical protein